MESKFGFKITQKANDDLNDIVSYIALELSNPKAASDFMDTLEQTIIDVCRLPKSGSPVTNDFIANTNIRKKQIKNYIMYYEVCPEEKMIYILRIVYGKRNLDEIIRQLNF